MLNELVSGIGNVLDIIDSDLVIKHPQGLCRLSAPRPH